MEHFTTTLIVAILLIGLALSVPADAAGKDNIPRGFIAKTIEMGEKDIKYVVYVPEIYDPKKPIPTIVFLNGYGECGTDGWRQVYHMGGAIMLAADKWPFLIIFPQKQYNRPDREQNPWEDQDEMMMAILKKCEKEYKIDRSRLYLTGLSQGGHGTWALGAKHADLFAAIAPVCGWGDKETAEKLAKAKMPIWTFHGDQDQAVDIQRSREMRQWIEEAGWECKLTVYPGVGHNSWDNAYRKEDLPGWFLQHHR
jgi:predicted peptidase